jgi:hypothetical protein
MNKSGDRNGVTIEEKLDTPIDTVRWCTIYILVGIMVAIIACVMLTVQP